MPRKPPMELSYQVTGDLQLRDWSAATKICSTKNNKMGTQDIRSSSNSNNGIDDDNDDFDDVNVDDNNDDVCQ